MKFALPLLELDNGARALGHKPLGAFMPDYYAEQHYEDIREDVEEADKTIKTGESWHDPDDGLQTLYALIRQSERIPASAKAIEGTLGVFRRLMMELEFVEQQGTRFQFGYDKSGLNDGYVIDEY